MARLSSVTYLPVTSLGSMVNTGVTGSVSTATLMAQASSAVRETQDSDARKAQASQEVQATPVGAR